MSLIINYEEFQNICRTCLFIGKLRPIIDSVLIGIIRGITGIEVKSDTELPQKICESCLKKIYKINEFALQCKRNESTLKKCRNEYFERNQKQKQNNEIESVSIKEEIITEDGMVEIKEEIKREPVSEPIEFINVAKHEHEQAQNTTEEKSRIIVSECPAPEDASQDETNCATTITRKKNKGSLALIKHHRTYQYQYQYQKQCRNILLNRNKLLHRKKSAQCNVCFKIFYDFDALKVHRRTHTATEHQFVCKVCHKRFSTSHFLYRHCRAEHPNPIEDDHHLEAESQAETQIETEQSLQVDPQHLLLINEESSYSQSECISNDADADGNKVRIRDRNYCMFCKTTVLNFVRHITRNHLKEPEVKKVLANPVGSRERKQLLSLLRKRGNYMLNYKECTKPVKKTATKNLTSKTSFLPCVYCLGFYARNQLWRHRKVCIAAKGAQLTKRPCTEAQNLLVRHLKVDRTLREMVFSRMRPDQISLVAKNDALICAFGARYLRVHDPDPDPDDANKHIVNVTSRKMRELAKLLMALKHREPAISTLWQSLQPRYFESVVAAVKTVANYDEATKMFASPTYALQMGTTLKQCCEIALNDDFDGDGNGDGDNDSANVHQFIILLESNWKLVVIVPNPPVPVPVPVQVEHLENTDAQTERTNKKRVLVPWTSEQKRVVNTFFKEHIATKRAPKKPECEALIQAHPLLLHNKNWLKIKVYVQNKYSK